MRPPWRERKDSRGTSRVALAAESDPERLGIMVLKMIAARRAAHAAMGLAAGLVVALVHGGGAEAQTRTERAFDDWKVLCVESDDGVKRCRMTQALIRSNPRQEVFRWVLVVNQENEMVNVLNAPLGVSLSPGIELLVEGGEPISVPYELCSRQGCQARLPMTAQITDSMAAGMPVQVTYVNPRGQRLRMEVTARGYREALNYLQSQIGS